MNIIGLRARNSPAFVAKVFELYRSRTPFAILKDDKGFEGIDLNVEEIIEVSDDRGWVDLSLPLIWSNSPAQLVFTSGTEGESKAILLSYTNLSDVVERLNSIHQLDSSVREYVGVPPMYSFGLGRFRACAAVGGKAFVPTNGFDPLEIAEMLRRGEINSISAVPTLWRLALSCPEVFEGVNNRVQWIEIGSQNMMAAEKTALQQLFPKARIIQHYGLTEASRTTLLDISSCKSERLQSVGRVYPPAEVKLSADGLIQIRGRHVALGRVSRRGIESLTDSDGWLTTKDLGRIEEGWVYFDGRADDLINCAGIKINPDTVEHQLMQELGLAQGICVHRIADRLRGDSIRIAADVDLQIPDERVMDAAVRALADAGLQSKGAVKVWRIVEFPRTATGKIQRSRLSELCLEEESRTSQRDLSATNSGSRDAGKRSSEREAIAAVWKTVLGTEEIPLDASFFELGGDSLSSIDMMIRLQKANIPREQISAFMAGNSITQVLDDTASSGLSNRAVVAHGINTARGILVLALIAIHWLPGVWARLPAKFAGMDELLNPFYRMGTPSFAIVFGIGVGYFYWPQYRANPSRVWRNIRFGSGFLATAIVVLALFRYFQHVAVGTPWKSPLASALCHSVLIYYLLAVLSIIPWFHLTRRSKELGLTCLVIGGLSACGYELLQYFEDGSQIFAAAGIFDLIRLAITAKYGYFIMTASVFMGIAVGTQAHLAEPSRLARQLMLLATFVGIAVLTQVFYVDIEKRWYLDKSIRYDALFLSWSLVMALVGGVIFYLSQKSHLALPVRVLSTIGILSLPMYVAHEIVIPTKDLLMALGANPLLGLGLPMSAFVIGATIAVRKLAQT